MYQVFPGWFWTHLTLLAITDHTLKTKYADIVHLVEHTPCKNIFSEGEEKVRVFLSAMG